VANYDKSKSKLRILLIILLFLTININCRNPDRIKIEFGNQTIQEDRIAGVKLNNSMKSVDFASVSLKYPDSKYVDSTLKRFSIIKDSIEYESDACGKYGAEVHVVDSTQILFNQELKPMDSLQFVTFDYLTSELVNNLEIKIPRSNKHGIFSSGHIHLVIMEDSINYRNVQTVIGEVKKGIIRYRNLLIKDWYGKDYSELRDSTKMYIDKLIQVKVSLMEFYEPNYLLPE
jgi:hypothetical protein